MKMEESTIQEQTLKSIKEGQAEICLKTDKVFYNPVQEFNRDLSIAVLSVFTEEYKAEKLAKLEKKEAKKLDNSEASSEENNLPITILEALSATGLRSIRYAKEVPNVTKIVANDISEQAVETIKANIIHNNVQNIIETSHDDACMVMYKHMNYKKRFAAIDLDPYGCPSIFLDSAVQSVQDGGLLLVTATDMAVLAGNSPETCYSKYGAVGLKTKSCHEMALRIMLQCIEQHANRYSRYIVPLLSISADFYIRVFVKVYSGAIHCKKTTSKLSMVYRCVGCDNITLQPLGGFKPNPTEKNPGQTKAYLPTVPPVGENCVHCNQRHNLGGPIWSSHIHDESFVSRVLNLVESRPELFGTAKRLEGVLSVVREEIVDAPLYYTLDKLFGRVHAETMPMLLMRSAILNAGYKVSYSHASKLSIKTHAPAQVIWDIIRAWVKNHPVKPSKFFSIMEKNTDDSQDKRNRKKKINDTADDEIKKREERLQKSRERSKRYREKKRNEDAALVSGGLTDADKEKREERLRYDREKSKRYREKKKNEVAALSMDAAHSSSDFSSDTSSSKMKKDRQKQNSKRYRDKIRLSNLLTPNISNRKNVSHSIPSSQIAGPSTIDVPYVLPIFYSSQIESISSRDVP